MNRVMTVAAAAALLLAGASLVHAAPASAVLTGIASTPDAAGSGPLLTQVQYRAHRHHRRRVYVDRPDDPGYFHGYGYTPPTDWTTRCMEDLGYGRRGMYGCGR